MTCKSTYRHTHLRYNNVITHIRSPPSVSKLDMMAPSSSYRLGHRDSVSMEKVVARVTVKVPTQPVNIVSVFRCHKYIDVHCLTPIMNQLDNYTCAYRSIDL